MADEDIITINIEDTLDALLAELDDFAADQLPFALAGALYDVALSARSSMRRTAPKTFTVRREKPWASESLTFDTASKKSLRDKIKSGEPPSISIISKDKDLGPLLTDGGVRKRSDGKEQGIPIIGGGRKDQLTPLNRATGAQGILKNNKNALVITAKNGRKLLVIYPDKYQTGVPKAQQHIAMFHMRKAVNIKPWWNARQILAAAMEKEFPKKFEKAMKKAMETRR